MDSIWLSINGRALHLGGRGIVIGACYAAPATSELYRQPGRRPGADPTHKVMGQLRDLIRRFKSPHDELLILGDFNARVAQLQDLPDVQADEQLEMLIGVPVGDSYHLRGIPDRRSKDQSTNSFGRAFIDLCRDLELVILNGRVHGDTEGEITLCTKTVSVGA
ncbi:hypothetical protein Vretifemale_13033 [Volvox reticuliferus]|uniref:Endonuclease/exonuclease/phosphatase domain-containing protein n=1 Tax=Volvox reticuliferus TaxID=1737510 RepID=A0A8J4CJG9_9CHLO|nr:hypothetical protein Vretifemale_13033 [Volvox reticuliferus]